jgi:hypothetical protein
VLVGPPTTDKKVVDSDDEPKETDPKVSAPVDYEFQFGMFEANMNGTELALPRACDGLFVTRPIDRYEPIASITHDKGLFKPDPTLPVKKKFPSQPVTHRDIRDINMELKGEEL